MRLAPQGVNVYWETLREPNLEQIVPLLAFRGRLIVMAGRDAKPVFPIGPFYVKDCSLFGFAMFNATPEEQRAAAEDINRWLAEGKLKPRIDRRYRTLRGPEHNPDLARALLAECGDATKAPVRLVYGEGTRWIDERMAGALVDDLGAVGIRLEPRAVKDVVEVRWAGDYDLIEARWIADYLDADAFTYWPFHSRLGRFRGLHESEPFDRLLEAARGETNPAERASLYRRVHYMFQEMCPALVLLHGRVFVIQARDVDGVRLYPLLPTVRPRDIWRAGGEE